MSLLPRKTVPIRRGGFFCSTGKFKNRPRPITAVLLKLIKGLLRHQPSRCKILFDDAGFTVIHETTQKFRIDWSDVCSVVAFRDDFFSNDEICIGFRCVDDDGPHRWVKEDHHGYRRLLKELTGRFDGIRINQLSELPSPYHAQQWTLLWGEPWSPVEK